MRVNRAQLKTYSFMGMLAVSLGVGGCDRAMESGAAFTGGAAEESSADSSGGGKKSRSGSINDRVDGDGRQGLGGGGDEGGGDDLVVSEKFTQCVKTHGDTFNIVMVFDNSGSQRTTDPTNVRRDGALRFVDKFSRIVKSKEDVTVHLATVKFSDEAQRGPNGWVDLSPQTRAHIEADIAWATERPDGETQMERALRQAQKFMEPKPKSSGNRNFVVVLTDGEPDDEVQMIYQRADELANRDGVAVMAVASGSGIEADGARVVEGMARPNVGVVHEDHIGRYYRAKTAADLKNAWDGIFDEISTCN